MKKLLLVAVLILTVSAMSFGQVTASQTANANLTVNAGISLTVTGGVVFGTVVQGQGSVVNAATAAVANVAAFTTAAAPSTAMTVTYSNTTLANGANTLTWTPSLVGTNNAANRATAPVISTGGSATTSATGNFYFWLGGTVSTVTATPSGTYSGTFTLTVAY